MNMTFGRLLVIGYVPEEWKWKCRCTCGNIRLVQGHHLRNGNTKSCGCYRNEFSEIHVTTHGKSKSEIYLTWTGMKDRCSNPSNPKYDRYGGRGIKVCDRWLNSFVNFSADMGKRPSGTTLDRINNNSDYEPSNCRWATRTQQARNKNNNRYFVLNGERKALPDWCELYGISYTCVYARLKRGWNIERALTTTPAIFQHTGSTIYRKDSQHVV